MLLIFNLLLSIVDNLNFFISHNYFLLFPETVVGLSFCVLRFPRQTLS